MYLSSEAHSDKQPNLIFTDAKGCLLQKLYNPLKHKGYNIKVLNMMDLENSISFNPLSRVVQYARNGRIGSAETTCGQIADIIYNAQGQGLNTFFYNQAGSLFSALTFALIAIANYQTRVSKYPEVSWKRINISSIINLVVTLGGETDKSGSQEYSYLHTFFGVLQERLNSLRNDVSKKKNPYYIYKSQVRNNELLMNQISFLKEAVDLYQQCTISGGKTAGSIYSTLLDRLRIFQQPTIARATALNTYNSLKMGFDRLLSVRFTPKLKLQTVSARIYGNTCFSDQPLEFYKANIDLNGFIKIPITKKTEPLHKFYVRLTVHDMRKDLSLTSTIIVHKHYCSPLTYLKLDRMSSKDLKLSLDHKTVVNRYTKQPALIQTNTKVIGNNKNLIYSTNLIYDSKPTALFIIVAPNKNELNVIPTILLKQTMMTLTRCEVNRLHLQRSIDFIIDHLDYFPHIPRIGGDSNILESSKHINLLLTANSLEFFHEIYGKDTTSELLSSCPITNFTSHNSLTRKVTLCTNIIVYTWIIGLIACNANNKPQLIQAIPVHTAHRYLNLEKVVCKSRKIMSDIQHKALKL